MGKSSKMNTIRNSKTIYDRALPVLFTLNKGTEDQDTTEANNEFKVDAVEAKLKQLDDVVKKFSKVCERAIHPVNLCVTRTSCCCSTKILFQETK